MGAAVLLPFVVDERGALKSLYSACHFAGVESLGRPYFLKFGLAGKGDHITCRAGIDK